MNRAFRIIKLVFLAAGLLLLLAIPVTGLISTAVNWQGFCYGFSDAQAPCSWWEFARDEIFWSIFIFIPYFFIAALLWMGMSLAQFTRALVDKRRKAGG